MLFSSKKFQYRFLGTLAVLVFIFFSLSYSPAAQANSSNTANCDPSKGSTLNCYQLLTPLPSGSGSISSINTSNPLPYIITLAEVLVSLSVVLAVFFIVYGGIIKMTTDNVEQKKEGNAIIYRTIIGLLMLAFSYILITTINPNLLKNPFAELGVPTGLGGGNSTNLAVFQAPSNISVTSCVPGKAFYLKWDEAGATNGTNYIVYLKDSSNQTVLQTYPNQQGGSQGGNTYAAGFPYSDLAAGGKYYVQLSPMGGLAGDVVGPSGGTSFTCNAPPLLANNVQATCLSDGVVHVTGTAPQGITNLIASYIDCTNKVSSDFNNASKENCAANGYTPGGLISPTMDYYLANNPNNQFTCDTFQGTAGRKYCISINPEDASGKSLLGVSISPVTCENPTVVSTGAPVTNLAGTCTSYLGTNYNVDSTDLKLTWSSPAKYTHFMVYINPANNPTNANNFGNNNIQGIPVTCENPTSCSYSTVGYQGSGALDGYNPNPVPGDTNTSKTPIYHTIWVDAVADPNNPNSTTNVQLEQKGDVTAISCKDSYNG